MTTYTTLREANRARLEEWCPDQKPDLSFCGNELAGEVGEACNVIKKLERERLGWRGSRSSVDKLAEELADVLIVADRIAMQAGIDLDLAVERKFNATSLSNGLKTTLSPTGPISMTEARIRGFCDDVTGIVTTMAGERLPEKIAEQVPMADLALFGYGPLCPCGERGMLPGDKLSADGETCAECAAADAAASDAPWRDD